MAGDSTAGRSLPPYDEQFDYAQQEGFEEGVVGVSKHFAPQVLRVCKTFWQQGSATLYSRNFFRFYSYGEVAEFAEKIGRGNAGCIENLQVAVPNLDYLEPRPEPQFYECLDALKQNYTNLRIIRMEIPHMHDINLRTARHRYRDIEGKRLPGSPEDMSSSLAGEFFRVVDRAFSSISSSPQIILVLRESFASFLKLGEFEELNHWMITYDRPAPWIEPWMKK